MNMIQERPILGIFIGLVVGLALGLFYAWVVSPVQWTGGGPAEMSEAAQNRYLNLVADLYSHENNAAKVGEALRGWPDASAQACLLAAETADPSSADRLRSIAFVNSNQQPCETILAGVDLPAEDEGRSFVPLFILGLLLLIVAGGIALVLNQRQAVVGRGALRPGYDDVPTAGPVGSLSSGEVDEQVTIPLARFRTTYTHGRDAYDDSFSIENTNGDFLGECGVGISESIGADMPKSVTACEVWLFDKNDIRTVTKVVMSDHAFFDEALKAKLAPKGEPILARENETIVLETETLIINAEITEMEYGSDELPPQSYFERLTIELSAWAKEGNVDGGANVEDRVDDLMSY
ncbi:MAG: hypothetical protein R6X32_05675 [Chloroflexota bacterium]